jgi:hypothetical protein
MNTSSFFMILLWSAAVYAQEIVAPSPATPDLLALQDPLMAILQSGGITLPTAILMSVWILANKASKWTPTLVISLKEPLQVDIKDPVKLRQLEPRK